MSMQSLVGVRSVCKHGVGVYSVYMHYEGMYSVTCLARAGIKNAKDFFSKIKKYLFFPITFCWIICRWNDDAWLKI
jgi:hypothetical protein